MSASEETGDAAVEHRDESRSVSFVMRGLLHDLANLATALDGVSNALKYEGAAAVGRAQVDLEKSTERMFALHAQLRSLLPDHGRPEAIDPREIAREVAVLLARHTARSCAVRVEEGPSAPILGEAWRVRRQLLAACDAAAGDSGDLAFSFRMVGDTVSAARSDGVVFWSAPTLSASRLRERSAD